MQSSPDPDRCRNCPLAGPGGTFSFLLRPEHGSAIESYSRLVSFRAGAMVVRQGEAVAGWQVLRSGVVRLYMVDDEGHERTVRFAHPGDLVAGCAGEVLGNPHGSCYSAEALTDPVEICHFPSGSLTRVFEECPALAEAFLGLMVKHLSDSYERLQSLTTTTVRERLVDALLRLGDAHSPLVGPPDQASPADGSITFRLARQRLADVLGVTKETAVRALSSLKELGLVETRGQVITIRNVEALKSLRDGKIT